MKPNIVILLVAGICAIPPLAYAETVPYVGLSAGPGLMHDSGIAYGGEAMSVIVYDAGLALDGAVGLKIDGLRLEAAAGYQTSGFDKQLFLTGSDGDENAEALKIHTAIRSYMVNGYADFDLGGGVVPFVMAGAGFANVDMKKHWVPSSEWWMDVSYSQDVFAWQVGAGVGFRVADRVMVDLSYRYFTASDIKLAVYDDWDDTLVDIASGKVMFGMRYSL